MNKNSPNIFGSNSHNNHNNHNNAPPSLASVLGEALEACVHQLLRARRVYPRDAFAPHRYLRVRCSACRVPAVVDYVVDALRVATPSIVAGIVDVLSVEIVSENVARERYDFSFDAEEMRKVAAETTKENVPTLVRESEWGLRNLLLSVVALEEDDVATTAGRRRSDDDGVSFRVRLRTAKGINDGGNDVKCDDLDRALREGLWYQPHDDDDEERRTATTKTTPIRTVHVPSCGLRIALSAERVRSKRVDDV